MKKLVFTVFLYIALCNISFGYIAVDSSTLSVQSVFNMSGQLQNFFFTSTGSLQSINSSPNTLYLQGSSIQSGPNPIIPTLGGVNIEGYILAFGNSIVYDALSNEKNYTFFNSRLRNNHNQIYRFYDGVKWYNNNTNTGFGSGKLKIGEKYFCMYLDSRYSANGDSRRVVIYMEAQNYSCEDTKEGGNQILLNYNEENPPPPPTPSQEEIEGLQCKTDTIPDYSATSWYNYGDLTDSFNVSDTTYPNIVWLQQDQLAGDRDITAWSRSGTGSTLPEGSFTYPGTAQALLLDPEEEVGSLNIDSTRGGQKTPYNIFQFFGTSNVVSQGAGIARVRIDGQNYQSALYSSGGTIVKGLKNSNGYIESLSIDFLGKFNGFRIGRAPMIEKRSCEINFNICEWRQEGVQLNCGAKAAVNGVPLGSCVITGSGSIYGAGSCVPERNASGAIIPPNPLAGGYVTLDGEGNVIGTVLAPEPAASFFDGVFECGINYDKDSWYKVVGKAIICPITVGKNLTIKLWDSLSRSQAGINQITQSAQKSLSGSTIDTSTGAAYTGSNVLVQRLIELEAGTADNKYMRNFKYALMAIFAVLAIAVVIAVIKNRNN